MAAQSAILLLIFLSMGREFASASDFRVYQDLSELLKNPKENVTAKDCSMIKAQGNILTGTYKINPTPSCFSTEPFSVMCDMDVDCGGWVVIQRRFDGSENFERCWSDYANGFGTPWTKNEHWLGLEKIHRLTQRGNWKLRIDLEDFDGAQTFIEYTSFRILEKAKYYQLQILSGCSGPGGNAFTYNGSDTNLAMYFTTMDANHAPQPENKCNKIFTGGWWFNNCGQYSNLNGKYQKQPCSDFTQDAMRWDAWMPTIPMHRIKKSEIKIKMA